MLGPEVADAGSDMLIPGNHRERREIRVHDDVSKAALPVAELEARQHVLGDVPAKKHVALSKSAVQRIKKVLASNALAAKDAFDVGRADFDKLDLSGLDLTSDLSNVHWCPSFLTQNSVL